jgi:hypothetical protein
MIPSPNFSLKSRSRGQIYGDEARDKGDLLNNMLKCIDEKSLVQTINDWVFRK